MTVAINLIRPSDNKVLKSEKLSRDTYKECEVEVQKKNKKKYVDERYWTIVAINQ